MTAMVSWFKQRWPEVLIASAAVAAIVALASFFIPRAHAADMPPRPAAVSTTPLPSIYTWQGAYAGLALGYGVELDNFSVSGVDIGNNPHGFTYGGRLGYDWQPGALVFGVMTDINGASFNNSDSVGSLSLSAKTDWWGSTNARAGLPFGNQLIYGTAGAAYGGKNVSLANFSASDTSFGWNGGIGIEGKFTKSMSAFVEGRYVDLGSVSLPIGIGNSQPFHFSVVQGGVNFHF